jgi:hypothetical protein
MSPRATSMAAFARALALLVPLVSVPAGSASVAASSPASLTAPADARLQASAPSSAPASASTRGALGKPAANDPVRTHIVRAVRQHRAFSALKGQSLDIRRIWVSTHWGYLCALVRKPDGAYQGTEGAWDVLQIVLQREGEVWTPAARLDGLSESSQQVQCASDAQGQITDAFLSELASNPALALRPGSPP